MAHKTLVNSTEYEITGGMTLVEGVSYSIQNGKVLVDGVEYDISFILPPSILDLWNYSNSDNQINCISYGNGYWVVGGKYTDGTIKYARIAYTTNLSGTWTIEDLWSSTKESVVTCITYGDGYWVAGGKYVASNDITICNARIAYSTRPDGAWTIKTVWSCDNKYGLTNGLKCIAYANGYWVVGGQYQSGNSNYAVISYATNPGGTWTRKNLWDTTNSYTSINCIAYGNGYWVAGGCNDLNGVSTKAAVHYASSPNGTWELSYPWTGNEAAIHCITYANGYWVVGGTKGVSKYYAKIAYSTRPSGTWTEKDLWNTYNASCIYSVAYGNGQWVAVGDFWDSSARYDNTRIAYTTDLGGTWTTQNLWYDSTNTYKFYPKAIAYLNGYWVVGGGYKDSSYYYARIAYSPTIEELGNTE